MLTRVRPTDDSAVGNNLIYYDGGKQPTTICYTVIIKGAG